MSRSSPQPEARPRMGGPHEVQDARRLDTVDEGRVSILAPARRPGQARAQPTLEHSRSGESGCAAPCFPRNPGPPTDHHRDAYQTESGAIRGRSGRVLFAAIGCGLATSGVVERADDLASIGREDHRRADQGEQRRALSTVRAAVRRCGRCVLGSRSSVCLLAGRGRPLRRCGSSRITSGARVVGWR